jgi:Patatin-like phospholipase
VFKVDQVLLQKIPIGDDQCRFDYNVLEKVMQNMIKERLNSENCSMLDAANAPYHVCPTFVVAKMAKHANGPPTVFRSYSGKGVRSNQCPIWQAARATSATPSFFKEMYIDNPRPGINYVDGGLGHNNPAEVALEEAAKIWPTAKDFCLISIGTGRQRAVQVVDRSKTNNDDDNVTSEQSLFEQIKSFIPSVAEFMRDWKTVTNFPPGVLALIKMAGALSKLLTDSEHVHQRVRRASRSTDVDKRFPYFRFNVERDVGDIGLEEWRKEDEMAAYTMAYLHEQEVEELKMECVECLMNPPKFKRMQQASVL